MEAPLPSYPHKNEKTNKERALTNRSNDDCKVHIARFTPVNLNAG